jgi:hypothetical protein
MTTQFVIISIFLICTFKILLLLLIQLRTKIEQILCFFFVVK